MGDPLQKTPTQSSTPPRRPLPPLRPYQVKAVDATTTATENLLLVAPTGSGKTRILIEDAKQSQGPILLICPWRTLTLQTAERFEGAGISTGVHLGSRTPEPGVRVTCTTLQTAHARQLGPGFKRIYFDEAHGSVCKTALTVLSRCKDAIIIGCTATACRLDRRPLGHIYSRLYEAASTRELMRLGYLVEPVVWAPSKLPDLSGVRWSKARGDYAPGAAGKVMSKPKLIGDSLAHWQQHARGLRTFAYCCNVAHARAVLERYTAAGISCAMVTGDTPQTERQRLLDAVRDRTCQILINVAVLTEGIDLPELECILIMRPTLSPGLHLQMVGRGLRTAEGKNHCVVLDHAGNFRRHGFPQDDWRWTLKPKRLKKKPSGTPPKARPCPQCGRQISPSVVFCPHCHTLFLPGEHKARLRRQPWRKRVVFVSGH